MRNATINRRMRNLYYFCDHLFWMLGKMYLCFLTGQIDNGVDCWYWVRIHLAYKSRFVGKNRMPLRLVVRNFLFKIWGLGVSVALIFGVYWLFSQFFK